MFESGYSDYNQLTLERELRAIIEPHNTRITPNEREACAEMQQPEVNYPILESIYEEWKPQYMQMNYLRHELDSFEGDNESDINERKERAVEILMIEKKLTKQWADSDYYKANGHLPNLPEREWKIPSEPIELANAINNCKRNIRRNRAQINKRKAANEEYSEYMQLFQYYKDYHLKLTGNEYTEKED